MKEEHCQIKTVFKKKLQALKVQGMLYTTESLFYKISYIKGRTQAEGV
jgi:hypothetical protein